ncbi:hypothetical protein C4F40_18085 [Sphingobacterium sp. Ka21]|uniref:Uncharacterized protein n=1 Tax=Sphingobacterium pedocola TaxID=2082722 RepID=A0ABR9TBI3_9SPHI|nr:hypothetical protein [Sphingobacterium pedocola]
MRPMISITTIQIWYIHSDVVISANKKGGVMYVALPFFLKVSIPKGHQEFSCLLVIQWIMKVFLYAYTS